MREPLLLAGFVRDRILVAGWATHGKHQSIDRVVFREEWDPHGFPADVSSSHRG